MKSLFLALSFLVLCSAQVWAAPVEFRCLGFVGASDNAKNVTRSDFNGEREEVTLVDYDGIQAIVSVSPEGFANIRIREPANPYAAYDETLAGNPTLIQISRLVRGNSGDYSVVTVKCSSSM